MAVAPTAYAVKRNGHERNEAFRRRYAQDICRATTRKTRYFVRGSAPQSFVT